MNNNKVVGVFVDIAQMYHAVRLVHKDARINYERYLKTAVGDHELHRAYAYGIQIKEEAESFITVLKNMGYEPKYKQARFIKIENTENELRYEIQLLKDKINGVVTPPPSTELTQYKPSIRDTSWNLGLAMDVVRNVGEKYINNVIIGSNDPELVPVIEWVKERGVKVTVFSFAIHKELRLIADQCREVGDDLLDFR